ncbi:ABC transporter E family member 1 [Raphanus sativus]|nr:ABC transporter E family member 1 [Raphanus sativus]
MGDLIAITDHNLFDERNKAKQSAKPIVGEFNKSRIHSYGPNSFKLHRLPVPVRGDIVGLVGPRSIGKTTALKILAGELTPNLGRFNDPPLDWLTIRTHLHDKHLRRFLAQVVNHKLKVVFKPQQVPQDYMGLAVGEILRKVDDRKDLRALILCFLDLKTPSVKFHHLDIRAQHRVTLAAALLQDADVYIFDDISSFLDMRQRFMVAQLIRSLKTAKSYVIVVDNDLSVIDYVSDYMYIMYGEPEAYGVFSEQYFDVETGIEFYLRGFDPIEDNLIRGDPLIFERHLEPDPEPLIGRRYSYPHMTTNHLKHKMKVEGGNLHDCQIHLVLGDQGTGKSTFIKLLAGFLPPDGVEPWCPEYLKSYKPKKISFIRACTVRAALETRCFHHRFVSDVIEPLQIDRLMGRKLTSLSPGERQRVAITFCLMKDAHVYLIDEPSLDLDSDMRIRVALAIRKHILRIQRAAVVVENDFLMAAYLADKVILVEPSIDTASCLPRDIARPVSGFSVSSPCDRVAGFNLLLEKLNITFRQVPDSSRLTPRVNKAGSMEDKTQKLNGNFYYNLA